MSTNNKKKPLKDRIRVCVNCGHEYIPNRAESKDCPKCHNPWNEPVERRGPMR